MIDTDRDGSVYDQGYISKNIYSAQLMLIK